MRRLLRDYGLVLLIVAGAAIAWSGVFRGRPDLPDTAPPLILSTPAGERLDLASLRGAPVILNFWASWCPPCRAEIPEFTAFAKDHPDVRILGVALESGDATAVDAAAREFGIGYTVLVGDDATGRAWDVSTLPTTVLVGPDGRVGTVHVGAMDREDLVRALEATLASGAAEG